MNIEEISHQYAVSGKLGEELFYDYDGLKKVLGLCKEHRVAILGLEGFNTIGDSIVPVDDAIADFSSICESDIDILARRSFEACECFLESILDPSRFIWSVVLNNSD